MTATSTQVGRFRFDRASGRWWWSDHMFLIHGVQPGDVVPTSELLLTHVHRDDRAEVREVLDRSVGERDPHACHYRLVDMSGATHRVVLAAACDGDGGVSGFLVDFTAAHDALLAERVNAELMLALESHAAIDQAKGILMLTYGVDEDAAFGILKQSSQRHNVRLREVAGKVVQAVAVGLGSMTRELLDETLCRTSVQQPPPTRRRHLDVQTVCGGDESIVRVSGSVDLSNRDELADAITLTMLGALDTGRVTVDLRGVGRIGPAVVDVLTAALRRSTAQGITLTIVGGGGPGGAPAPASTHRSSISSRS